MLGRGAAAWRCRSTWLSGCFPFWFLSFPRSIWFSGCFPLWFLSVPQCDWSVAFFLRQPRFSRWRFSESVAEAPRADLRPGAQALPQRRGGRMAPHPRCGRAPWHQRTLFTPDESAPVFFAMGAFPCKSDAAPLSPGTPPFLGYFCQHYLSHVKRIDLK